jgi:hypothetical protein
MKLEIEVGDEAFVSDRSEKFGAIRNISPDGRTLTVWVEHAGEFAVPASAVVSTGEEKVTFDGAKLDEKLRLAIGHAHDAETE